MTYLIVKKEFLINFYFARHAFRLVYLVNFDLIYRSITNLGILSSEDLDSENNYKIINRKKKKEAINLHQFFPIINMIVTIGCHHSKEELIALQKLCQNEYIIIQKSDKSNFIVKVEKNSRKKKTF